MSEEAIPAAARQEATARRRVRNYLVDPALQLRLGGYLAAVAAALSLALGYQLWRAYAEASKLVALGEPRTDEVLAALLARDDRTRILWMAAILAGVVVVLLALSVVVTHRIAGPALAIARTCRAVGEGRLLAQRPLRRGDLLGGLAGEVGAMVDALRAREARERAVLADAARALATGGEQARAREIIERLAAEKARRLDG